MACQAPRTGTFQPLRRLISSITRGNPTTVVTTFDHDYLDGEIVRLIVPDTYGMRQINKLSGTITVTNDTTFTIDINSTNFDPFVAPANPKQCAQTIPFAEVNSIIQGATQNVLRRGRRTTGPVE